MEWLGWLRHARTCEMLQAAEIQLRIVLPALTTAMWETRELIWLVTGWQAIIITIILFTMTRCILLPFIVNSS